MAETEYRVRKLEITLARFIGGGVVAVVAILAFIGDTSLYQIPTQVRTAVSGAVTKYVEEKLPGFDETLRSFLIETGEAVERAKKDAGEIDDLAESLRNWGVQVQTGIVEIHKDKMAHIWDVQQNHCPRGREGQRGELSGRVNFPEPFSSPPQVLLALSGLDFASDRNIRIRAIASKVDEAGFDYLLYTWCNTRVWWIRASWIAVAE